MRFVGLSFLSVVLAAGCSERRDSVPLRGESTAQLTVASAPAAPEPALADGPVANDQEKDRGKSGGGEARPRKIIRTGAVTIEVVDQEAVRAEIGRLVRAAGGFVAGVEVGRLEGAVGAATLVLRIPEGRLDGTLAALGRLGTVRRESLRADDVSESYYDLAARLRNGKRLEERLVELAGKAAGVKDLLEVEREVGRVREQIEVMEGQMRGLDDQTSLATLTVEVLTRTVYTPLEEPGLGAKIERAFDASLDTMADLAEALLLFLVSAVPWIVPIGAGTLLLRRRLRRRVG